MTNTPSMTAPRPASISVPKREWKKPVLDILSLEEAEHGGVRNHDFLGRHHS
jgi:hypothetical protein